MNYEKKYKEALERAKKLYEQGTITESLSNVFPELKESEDERIRTGLINGFKECLKKSNYPKNTQKYWHNIKIEDILAWLEKQGERKETLCDKCKKAQPSHSCQDIIALGRCYIDAINTSSNKVEPKFHEGDYIKHNKANLICKVISVNSGSYYVENIETGNGFELFSAEQNFHLWTIADAKDGDVLLTKHNQPFIYNGIFDEESVGAYCGINSLGTDLLEATLPCNWSSKEGVKPTTKEQRDLLFQKMKEAGYEFNFEKKELKKIEQKPKWSYEDEANLNNIIWLCNNCLNGEETTWIPSQAEKIKHLIETIKERGLTQQKPKWTDEDVEIVSKLQCTLNHVDYDYDTHKKLDNWLKQLKQRTEE